MSLEMPPTSALPVFGLMGAPGSGKSTVARLMQSRGGAIIDADALAKQALNIPEVLQELKAWWGPAVVTAEGLADRSAIAERVFDQPQELARLEQLIHPRVHQARYAQRSAAMSDPDCRFVVEDCPLLLETGLDEECDRLVLVEASWDTRVARVQATRGWSADELSRREARQLPLDTKRSRADHVLHNDAGVSEKALADQIDRLLTDLN